MKVFRLSVLALVFSIAMGAHVNLTAATKPRIERSSFGTTQDGQAVDLYVLTNQKGMSVAISNYGGTVVSLKVPDRDGKSVDVVLGYDTLHEYETGKSYFGATIGRYGNRIAHGKFSLNGQTYTLPKNDGDNTLHGGILGFNKRLWKAREIPSERGLVLEMTYVSRDGEEGFPGDLTSTVVFTVPVDRNELKIDYTASTDKDTVTNLTNHSYFNLSGAGNGDILGHQLTLVANRFTPVDAALIPTGKIEDVKNTPFDFLKPNVIGARINGTDEQLKLGRGYDHDWVLDHSPESTGPSRAAEAFDPKSGRVLEVLTTEPGIQFYSGNFLDDSIKGKGGKTYGLRTGFCLETQHFPDSPNQPSFPSTVLKPGTPYHSTTIFRFSTR